MEPKEHQQLGDFHEDCQKLDADSFAGRHGEAFLIHHGPIGALKLPGDQDKTMNFDFSTTDPRMSFNPGKDFLVFPVSTSLANTAEENIFSIGRNETNEIVVPDMTMSAIHAFLSKREDGQVYLQARWKVVRRLKDEHPVAGFGAHPERKPEDIRQVDIEIECRI